MWALPVMSQSVIEREGHLTSEAVLAVEDNALLLNLVCCLLNDFGYTVFPASSTEEALDYLHNQKYSFDLLFTDIRMPGEMDGVSLARKMRQLRPDVKVLLTTGFAPEFLPEAGHDDFPILQKPYSPDDLANTVREILGR